MLGVLGNRVEMCTVVGTGIAAMTTKLLRREDPESSHASGIVQTIRGSEGA